MTKPAGALTRRRFIQTLGLMGGAGAAYQGMTALGLLAVPNARAEWPSYPPDAGRGTSAIIIGAGMAGLCSAYLLARHGFTVKVLEAGDRFGGRSLTLRRGDTFSEVGGPTQTCNFIPNRYPDGSPTESEPYFNAGPGRIPQHHGRILDYCRRLGVRLEPYIYLCDTNKLQSDKAFGGKPISHREVRFSLLGEVNELLAKATQTGGLDTELSNIDRESFLDLLSQFGDLTRKQDGRYVYERSSRTGYVVEPGAGLDLGEPNPSVPLKDIVESGFWRWDPFGDLAYQWQTSLMQPVGGMDMIWRAFLRQTMPDGRPLEDLVTLEAPVSRVRNLDGGGVEVVYGDGVVDSADFVISTMAPIQLIGAAEGFSVPFINALAAVDYWAAVKIGLQMKSRFWETEDSIYGGISWTDGPIRQIWYPSSEYQSENGVLTAAYNILEEAEVLGRLPLEERFAIAVRDGEKLHPGQYEKNLLRETALSLAWHKMPYFIGGFPGETARENTKAYERLIRLTPEGNVYLAGDFFSYWAGWQEGAIDAAELAVSQITERVLQKG